MSALYYFCITIQADVAKLVDALDLGSSAARCVGSSPSIRTTFYKLCSNTKFIKIHGELFLNNGNTALRRRNIWNLKLPMLMSGIKRRHSLLPKKITLTGRSLKRILNCGRKTVAGFKPISGLALILCIRGLWAPSAC